MPEFTSNPSFIGVKTLQSWSICYYPFTFFLQIIRYFCGEIGKFMKKIVLFLTLVALSTSFFSCVPARKLQDAQAMIEKLNAESADCKKKSADLQAQLDKMKDDYDKSQKDRSDLMTDTA